ncbi:MAG: hypothetical protein KC777_06320 [Cyanobacteria bacterium HKST-UBA02]|nr:hypothetical protein [Cyanobacteria bacterium HKST-UBA02]
MESFESNINNAQIQYDQVAQGLFQDAYGSRYGEPQFGLPSEPGRMQGPNGGRQGGPWSGRETGDGGMPGKPPATENEPKTREFIQCTIPLDNSDIRTEQEPRGPRGEHPIVSHGKNTGGSDVHCEQITITPLF